MKFNFKSYQIFKLKKYFKNQGLFFIFQSVKLNLTKWVEVEQNLKKLKLNYFKPLNKTTVKSYNDSIYKNFSSSINGFNLFISIRDKKTEFNTQFTLKALSSLFVLTGIKLNNKIYSPSQLKTLKELSYKKKMYTLHNTLDKYLKKSYVLTKSK